MRERACSRPRSSSPSPTARPRRRRRARAPSARPSPRLQSLRIAIASSMPPRYAWFFWKTCMTTRGWRPSREQRRARVVEVRVRVVAGAHLLDREVEDLRVETATRAAALSPSSSSRQARERGLGHLELLRRRLGGREPVLELVAGLRERLGERCAGVARHPAEELGRRRDRAELRRRARAAAQPLGREPGERCRSPTSTSSGPSRWPPQRSCSFVAPSPCSYVPIEMCSAPWYAASSPPRSASSAGASERDAGEQLLRRRPQPLESRTPLTDRAAPSIAPSTRGPRIGSCAAGSLRFTCRAAAPSPRRAAPGPRSSGFLTPAAWKRLRAEATSISAVLVPDRARPGRRAVHEHAVRRAPSRRGEPSPAHRRGEYRPRRERSACCSAAAAAPGRAVADRARRRRPTTGITSRIDEVRNTSSAATQRASGKTPSAASYPAAAPAPRARPA